MFMIVAKAEAKHVPCAGGAGIAAAVRRKRVSRCSDAGSASLLTNIMTLRDVSARFCDLLVFLAFHCHA